MSLTNEQLSELLVLASEHVEGNKQKALRRAGRAAYAWPVEVTEVEAAGGALTDLPAVGPWVAGCIRALLDDPPEDLPDPPPIRAGFMSWARARRVVAGSFEDRRALRGDLQMHSRYSDGKASIRAMALAGLELGHEYIAITDHSKGLKIAGGIDEDTLARQAEEIEGVNDELAPDGIRVLQAMEMNISPSGEGDMDPAALARLDLVLGSFHSKLRVTEDQTDRYLAALANPDIHVLGHPRGRIFNFRAGLQADWERVFAEAARRGKAVEVDCYPDRQDLNVELLTLARDAGCYVSIGTDAHNEDEMSFIDIGVAAIVATDFPRDRVLNLMPVDDLLGWTASVRGK